MREDCSKQQSRNCQRHFSNGEVDIHFKSQRHFKRTGKNYEQWHQLIDNPLLLLLLFLSIVLFVYVDVKLLCYVL